MKKARFADTQMVVILKETDTGMLVKDICRKHGISDATYYNNWKSEYGGMEASDLRRMKELERAHGDHALCGAHLRRGLDL